MNSNGKKYETVEPFSIVMPGEEFAAYESDTTQLLECARAQDDPLKRMKEYAKQESRAMDEKLKHASAVDGYVDVHCL